MDLSSANPDQWTPVSPTLLKAKTRALIIGTGIFLVLGFIPFLIWNNEWLLAIPGAIMIFALVRLPVNRMTVKNTAYLVRADEILVRTGALSRSTIALPFGRIQRVDLHEGIIDSSLGLAQLTFESAAASGSVSIPGVPVQDAKNLRDAILSAAEVRRVQL